MSRRETIIVAVLVNAGLLIVLFASALKSSPATELVSAPPPVVHELTEPVFKKEMPLAVGDEVDHALSQFSQKAVVETQVAAAPPSPTMDFAEDLRMIAQPQAPVETQIPNPSVRTLTTPVPQAKTGPDFIEIKVKKGDVLEKIARHHHTTVAEIMKVNKLATTQLRIGQALKIPNKTILKAETSTIAFSEPQTPATTNPEGAKYYVVKKGDSPWTIAIKNHIKVEDLLKLNNMSEEQARRLKPGDQLRIQ